MGSENIRRLKILASNLFEELKDINLFLVKCFMLEYIVKDVSQFAGISISDVFPCEYFNYVI